MPLLLAHAFEAEARAAKDEERERCAKVCDSYDPCFRNASDNEAAKFGASRCASRIRETK